MKGKVKLSILVIGIVLYVFDITSDAYVAVQYYRTEQWWWFGLTLTFIIVPVIIINSTSFVQSKTVWQITSKTGRNRDIDEIGNKDVTGVCGAILTCCLCSSIFFLFYEEILRWKETYMVHQSCGENYRSCSCQRCKSHLEQQRKSAQSAHKLAWIRYIETVCESAPQWCLQVYIMLRQWYFPWYTVLSTAISLVALAWSITSLEKTRQEKNETKNFNFFFLVVFLLWQVSFLISRLAAIVYCAYVLRYYVFVIIGMNWLLASIVIKYQLWKTNIDVTITACLFQTYAFVFNMSEPLQSFFFAISPRRQNVIMTTIFALVNILMLVLGIAVSVFDVPYKEKVKPIAIACVAGGLVLGTFFCLLYYKICPPPATENEQPNTDPAVIFNQRREEAVARWLGGRWGHGPPSDGSKRGAEMLAGR